MKQFLVSLNTDRPTVASIRYDEKSALDILDDREEAGFQNWIVKEFVYKPEPNDVKVIWVVYYTINGTEFSEVFKTRGGARWEKKDLQENYEFYPNKPENIYIQREEVWVADKKKVS